MRQRLSLLTEGARYRRLFGLFLGAAIGLVYGLVSQTINYVVLPGISFYQPPLGPAGNIGLCVLGGAALGVVNAWLADAVVGTFVGSAAGALLIAASTMLAGEPSADIMPARTMMLVLIFLPIVAALVPLLAVHRWVVNKEARARTLSTPRWARVGLPLVLVIVAGVVGGSALYSSPARLMLSRTNELLQAGLAASDAASLPSPLQSDLVGGFLDHSQGAYTLAYDKDDINRFAIPRRMTDRPWEEAVVIARFESGWVLVCLFPKADAEPACKGFGAERTDAISTSAPSQSAAGTGPGSSRAALQPPEEKSVTPERVVSRPSDDDWDDRSIFREGLVEAEQGVLDRLPGATVYRIDLRISDDCLTLWGHQQAHYTNREDKALDEIYFRLFPNLGGGEATLSAVQVDGRDIDPVYELQRSAVRVELPTRLEPGEQVDVQMDFVVKVPQGMDGNHGLFGFSEGVLALDEFYPVIPVYDDEGWNVEIPSPNADVTYFDASFYRVRVTAPAELILVASGVEVGHEQEGGTQEVTFAAGPARDFYIAASERYVVVSETVGETTINSYTVAEWPEKSQLALQYAGTALQSFNRRFGVYPYTELDVASTPMDALGVEYPGIMGIALTLYAPDQSSQPFFESTVAHEVAHQWFYNVVGSDQVDEPWLDEAVVQYATWLYYADTYGEPAAQGFRDYWESCWARVDRAAIPVNLPAEAYTEEEYVPIVYCRGPLFVMALADEMGQEHFDRFLRDYYESHKWGIGTAVAFRQFAERHCQCDLTALFAEWAGEE
jgi:hypothetical protein